MSLTVAVTGPTGELGRPFIAALETLPEVGRIVGMARRPFDPAAHGWTRTEYRRGDVTHPDDVASLVADADVVVHLAFIIFGDDAAHDINLEGARLVFEATAAAGVERLVYASSVAAYGFHTDNPQPLTEETPVRGTEAHPYSAQKAAAEAMLQGALLGSRTQAYVFRPCIVAGPQAPALMDQIPYHRLAEHLPGPTRAVLGMVPGLKPVLPDPGVPFQLVHHDDVASALCSAVLGAGAPGVYNLAGPGTISVADVASALGYRSVRVPKRSVDATAGVIAHLPRVPAQARWIEAFRTPVLMDTSKARRELHWTPAHDAADTLAEMVAAKH